MALDITSFVVGKVDNIVSPISNAGTTQADVLSMALDIISFAFAFKGVTGVRMEEDVDAAGVEMDSTTLLVVINFSFK